jgi:anti-sigma B factor antagonist
MAQRAELQEVSEFRVDLVREGDVAQLFVCGELDLSTVPTLNQQLAMADGAGTILIDLADLSFMDCSGLSAFIVSAARAKARGTRLVFDNCQRQVKRVFALTGMEGLLAEDAFAMARRATQH